MDVLFRQLLVILRSMWKRRWLGLIVAWVVGVIGATTVFLIPDKYEASARIFVDTQSILKPLMAGLAIDPNVDQQVMILSRTLISRPNVEKLVRMADLDLKIKTKEEKDRLVDELMKVLAIKSTGRDNLYTLNYRDSNPDQAKRVVQSLVSIFVESSLGDKRKDTDSARKFIDDQIQAYEKKLEEAETRLKEFKLRNIAMQAQDGRDFFGRLGSAGSELARAQLELREAENSRDALKRQLLGEEPILLPDSPEAASVVSVPEIDARIDAMKRNLDGMLQRFTDQHPDVVGTRRVIKELEEQKLQEIAARKKSAAANPAAASINGNPVYQQLKVSLAESEASVASLRARVAEYQARYNQMKTSINLVPQIEAEFAQLNRDYEVHKKNYETLVSRRESANISGEMEASVGVADFRLIDPPRVSPQPVAPNRLLMLPLTLLIALVAGLAACFVMTQVRPVVVDARSLREITGLPLLGAVSMVENESGKRRERRNLRRFLAAFASLLMAYAAGVAALLLLSARSA